MVGQVVRLNHLRPKVKQNGLAFLIRVASKDLTAMGDEQT